MQRSMSYAQIDYDYKNSPSFVHSCCFCKGKLFESMLIIRKRLYHKNYKKIQNIEDLINQFHCIPIQFSRHKYKIADRCCMYSKHKFSFYFTITPRNSGPDCYLNHELVLEFAPLQFFSYH